MTKKKIPEYPFIVAGNRIDERKLLAWLTNSKLKRHVKPVLSPPAPSTKLCEIDNLLEVKLNDVLAKRESLMKSNKILWYIIEIQIVSGCRISEVLSIRPNDISLSGHVLLKGAKGSENKTVYVSDSRKYLEYCKKNGIIPFQDFNRFFVYREYKKLGINFTFDNKGKESVTHFFRQCNARLMESSEINVKDIQSFLSHKSENSTTYYVKNRKKGS